MKTVFLWLLLIVAVLPVGGCVLMSPEDRDFYGKGWVKPTDLDTPPVHHTIPDPSRPQTTNTASTRTAPAAEPAPEWITPIPSTQ